MKHAMAILVLVLASGCNPGPFHIYVDKNEPKLITAMVEATMYIEEQTGCHIPVTETDQPRLKLLRRGKNIIVIRRENGFDMAAESVPMFRHKDVIKVSKHEIGHQKIGKGVSVGLMVHELVHAFGRTGHVEDPDNVMYYIVDDTNWALNGEQIAWIQDICRVEEREM